MPDTKVKKPRRRLEVYPTKGGWGFRAIAGNGKNIGRHDEAIQRKASQIKRAQKQFPDMPVVVYDKNGDIERIIEVGADV